MIGETKSGTNDLYSVHETYIYVRNKSSKLNVWNTYTFLNK